MFHSVYALQSKKDHARYDGYTTNLKRRILEHNKGLTFSTMMRRPFKLIYFEGCLSEIDAKRREHYLKTTRGRRFMTKRLIQYLSKL